MNQDSQHTSPKLARYSFRVYNVLGELIYNSIDKAQCSAAVLQEGLYRLEVQIGNRIIKRDFIVEHAVGMNQI